MWYVAGVYPWHFGNRNIEWDDYIRPIDKAYI